MSRSTRRRGRLLVAAAAAAVAALSITACSSGGSPAADDPADSGTLDWWGFSPNVTVANDLIAEFNKEYPDITVNYKFYPNNTEYPAALRAGLASNEGPDLFNLATNAAAPVDQFGSFAVDLAPAYEAALGADWKDKVSPLAIDSFTLENGSLAAASLGYVSAGLLYINQDLFDQYGLTPPTTLDEWKQVCATFTANGVECFTVGAGTAAFNMDPLHSIANSLHPGDWQKASEGEISWNDDWFIDTLQAWSDLRADGIMQDGALGLQQYPDANNEFLQEKAAMVQMGTWYNGNLLAGNMTAAMEGAGVANPEPFTMVPIAFPDFTNKGEPGALFSDVDSAIAVNKKSDSINAATTFAMWLATSETGQQDIANRLELLPDSGALPDFSAIDLVNPEVQQPVLEAFAPLTQAATDEARFRLIKPNLYEALGAASTAVLEGTSPADAAASVQAAADEDRNS
ncbi:extracellular solute-binding protein [Cnuibacter physcomitrellae]|uniref:ABC transporter substrate-binding protein n=1 Tax=Cnuibacter physcomitrellae TaxID=1619308 RepID=UPI002175EBE0|nr:extracellular solute-binding protein [Cnuibacter physcomitrellae]MCS5498367.1 extracellular solute-binding protein [Cnuibacter physcomitrellae]